MQSYRRVRGVIIYTNRLGHTWVHVYMVHTIYPMCDARNGQAIHAGLDHAINSTYIVGNPVPEMAVILQIHVGCITYARTILQIVCKTNVTRTSLAKGHHKATKSDLIYA